MLYWLNKMQREHQERRCISFIESEETCGHIFSLLANFIGAYITLALCVLVS